MRSTVVDVATNTGDLLALGRRATDVARRLARRSAPSSPLNTTVSRHRRFTVASAPLADFRRLRARYDCDVNDVVLTVIAGALRNWLLSRGEPVSSSSRCGRWRPPLSTPDADMGPRGLGRPSARSLRS